MLFSSLSFLFYFLPAVMALYFLSPYRLKNLVLLLASLFFYFYGEPVYCLLMIAAILQGYLHGLWISRSNRHKKLALISSIVVSAGILVTFKYSSFLAKNLNLAFGSSLPVFDLALPLGISFYTFQILSYTIDLYRGTAGVQKNLINFAAYVSLFPQLIAGPIVRYTTVESALTRRTHSVSDAAAGIARFITGLSKKVIFANTLGELGVLFSNADERTVLFYWIAAVAFVLQIYFDFSGYSDMAVGLGRVFGFRFPENFNYPYIAKSASEFWRRWHITLGAWFRDYVYIPLGGNRTNLLKWFRNILIVWFLTGFWHGAEWNFVIWGLYFAFFLAVEKLFLQGLLSRAPSVFGHIYLLFIVTVSFVIFNAGGIGEAVENLKGMFGLLNVPFSNAETLYHLRNYAPVLVLAAVAATPLFKRITQKIQGSKTGDQAISIMKPLVLISLLLLVTGYLIDGSFNPFIYFRF